MIKILTGRWPVFISGSVVAFILVFGIYLLDTPVGMSDAYVMISDYCRSAIANRGVDELPLLDWQTGFLVGILIGAACAALTAGKWKLRIFPEERKSKNYLKSTGITPLQGVIGGFLVMLGLQLAGDSFIGQWAAAVQLSTGAWVFLTVALFSALVAGAIIMMLSSDGANSKGKSRSTKEKH